MSQWTHKKLEYHKINSFSHGWGQQGFDVCVPYLSHFICGRVPLFGAFLASGGSGSSASSGELEREMKDGSARELAAAASGASREPRARTADGRGLAKTNPAHMSICPLFPSSEASVFTAEPLGGLRVGGAHAPLGTLAVLQLAASSARAGTRLGEVRTHQSVFLLALVGGATKHAVTCRLFLRMRL